MAKTKLLIDTQVFIWLMDQKNKLSKDTLNLLSDTENDIFLSIASVWEISIKKSKNRLHIPKDIKSSIDEAGFNILDITIDHILEIEKLPHYHEDPFDRLLIAQAKVENITLITADNQILRYEGMFIKA